MGIGPKREGRVGVANLIGYPADVFARVKREGIDYDFPKS